MLDSERRAITIRTADQEQAGFRRRGRQGGLRLRAEAGGGSGRDAATMAGMAGREVVTVRYTSSPAGRTPSIQVAQQMLEGVLSSMAG